MGAFLLEGISMDIDFAPLIAEVVADGAVLAIVGFGVVKLFPGFTMWAVDKVAGMFGYDPYGRDSAD